MYFLIGADFVPTKCNLELFVNGNKNKLIGDELISAMEMASFRIFNLETPLVDIENPIIKQGPNLSAPTQAVNGYSAVGVNLFTLANNHILDQGTQGLESTIETLNKNGIYHLGAGQNLDAASKPFIFEFEEKKIGVYACAEHEFSIASDKCPGANPFDPLWSLDHIAELKRQVEYVIVLYHGGKEHYRYPSPYLQKTCRRLIDKGADLVVCQHSHCIGCEEEYKDGRIIYGQGNFIFDDSDEECWRTGLLIRVNADFGIEYIPFVKNEGGIIIAKGDERLNILEGFAERSNQIKKEGFVENKYNEFSHESISTYLDAFCGSDYSLVYRGINKLTCGLLQRINRNRYRKKSIVKLINYIECEAHKELCLSGLKGRINQ